MAAVAELTSLAFYMPEHFQYDEGLPEPKEYPLSAWLQDCDWYFEATKRWPKGLSDMAIEPFQSRFSETRPDPVVADYCLQRFFLAVSFLQEHAPKIDFGKAVVVGSDVHLVSKPVMVTLYRFFAAIPDHALDDSVPIDLFIDELKNVLDEKG